MIPIKVHNVHSLMKILLQEIDNQSNQTDTTYVLQTFKELSWFNERASYNKAIHDCVIRSHILLKLVKFRYHLINTIAKD